MDGLGRQMVTEDGESVVQVAANSVEPLAAAMVEGRDSGKEPAEDSGCKELVEGRGYMEAGG